MTAKRALDLLPGDVVLIDGDPSEVFGIDSRLAGVGVHLSSDPDDVRWCPRDAVVQVFGHCPPGITPRG